MQEFYRLKRLPPYVFAQVQALKLDARHRGEDIIDFGMGNPDQPTPPHIVDKLIEVARNSKNHRYSASRGITRLRHAITSWYKRNYDVDLDPETEAIVTIGSKEGIAHLALALVGPGDVVLTPTPTYPIHMYSVIIAGGEVRGIELRQDSDFFDDLIRVYRQTQPRPRILILNFPHNPTTAVVDLEFFKKIVAFAKEHNVIVVHDLAYADLVFDGYRAPSLLQVPEAKDVGVEFYTLSKSYNMPVRSGSSVDPKEKVNVIEEFDRKMLGPILDRLAKLGTHRVAVLCETWMSAGSRPLTRALAPYLFYEGPAQSKQSRRFTEEEAQAEAEKSGARDATKLMARLVPRA